jgi:competence protein ComEC
LTALLGVPLVAAGAVAALCALASLAHPLLGLALAVAIAAAAAALALASTNAPRRVLWAAVAVVAVGTAMRAFIVPPALGIVSDPRVEALRAALGAPLRALVPEPESALLMGIVLGERAGIGRDLREAFAATGTAHLLAISGSNMTLVAAAVSVALRGHARPVLVAAATVLALAAYTVLVGPQPSVARAALMAGVASLGLALGRRGAAANALGAAVAVMLVIDPRALEDVGFLLSVAATAGLIAWERPIARRLGKLPPLIAGGLAATVAASAPTIPIVAAVFGRISLVSPLANLVAVPLFAPIMLFGAVTAAVGAVVPAAAWPLAMAAYASAAALRHIVELGAAVPLASIAVPAGIPTGAAVTLGLAAGWVAARRVAARVRGALRHISTPRLAFPRPRVEAALPGSAIALCVLALVAGAITTSAFPRPSGFRLHLLDVGQGDAFLLESDGRYALIDGGPDPSLLLRRLGEVLPPWHRRIDLVALTHEHADHGNGLLAVLDRYDVGLALEPAGMAEVPLTQAWWERLARGRVPRRAVAAGAVVRFGSTTLRVLAPGRDRRVAVPSLVVRASQGPSSILFMGDATDDAIADLLLAPDALAARVYVPPHHGSDTAHARALVAAVRPAAAVISVGAVNRYGHPTPATLAALETLPVYRTDRYGTVVLTLDADPLVVRTAKAGVPPHRGGPLPRASASR